MVIFRFEPFARSLVAVLLPVACCLLPVVFFSCSNGEADLPAVVSNDSAPSDIRAINDKINTDRNNADLYFQRAQANFRHKNFENAIGDIQIALRIDSTKPAYHIFLSDLYFTQNRTRDTRDELRKAIAIDSTNAEALMKYSQLFYLLKKYDTATVFINRSLHFNNASPVAHFQKGMILKEWGDTLKAISSFQTAVEFDQKYYDAYMQLGLLHSTKNNPLALGYFDNALAIEPNSTEAHYAKGMFFQNAGQYDQALAEYNSILQSAPEHQNAIYNTGAVLFEQKKTDEAMEKFQKLIDRDKNYFRGYYGLGRCYEAKGLKKEAVDAYRKSVSIQPDFAPAAIQLSLIEGKGRKK